MRHYIRNMVEPLPQGRPPSRSPYLPRFSCRLPRRNGSGVGFVVAVLVAAGLAAFPARTQAQDLAAIEAITKLNARALEEYDNLNFDKARKSLNEALDLCSKKGLDNHAIKARTLIHVGVVILGGGITERDAAIKEFQKALAVDPNIKLTSRVANPEVQSAFDEAAKSVPTMPSTDSPVETPAAQTRATPKVAVEPEAPTMGLEHTAIKSAAQGAAIPISVTTDAALEAKKVTLAYRPEGAAEFVRVELKEYSKGNWSGSIPDSATEGDEVAYALSVQNEAGEAVGTHGSPEAPIVITLKAGRHAEKDSGDAEPEEAERAEPVLLPTWFFGLSVGSGIGWASGYGDVNNQDKVTPAFGASKLGHVLPEVGYFVSPDLLLSLQLRIQSVSGATPFRSTPPMMMCGADQVCEPAKGALAAFAKMTWLYGEAPFLPYLSLSMGAGQIRHLAGFPGKNDNCGSNIMMPVKCVDTVTAGPILFGPGAGFILNATPNFGFTVGVNTLLGFPQFTFHVDVNAGIVIEI